MIKVLKKLNNEERWLLFLAFLFILSQVWLDLKVPDQMATLTRLMLTPGTELSALFHPGLSMIGFSLFSFASSLITGFLAARIGASFSKNLRREVFNHILDFSENEIQSFSIPSLLTRTTNDINQLQILIAMGMQVTVKGPIIAVWAILKIAESDPSWVAATALTVIGLLVSIFGILYFAFPKQKIIQQLTDKLNAITRENITGVRVIRAFNAEENRTDQFKKINRELTDVHLFSIRMFSLFHPLMMLVSTGLTLSVYWLGAHIIDTAPLALKITRFSEMTVFTSYAMLVVMGFMMMTMTFMFLPRSIVSARRINEVLDQPISIDFLEEVEEGELPLNYQIIFDNVTFKYSEDAEPVVENINFSVKKGQTLAFIGSTGSGKSTLINLIPRFYDVSHGQIILDGQNIKNYSLEQLANKIGYIPQKPVIFSGTIASNLNFGESKQSPLDKNKMKEALEIAQALSFVESKDGGLEAKVSQNGGNLSGGQKQRLAIARAIARKPEILIFDDSFSALDYQTDKALRQALASSTKGMTKLIVAQRISTIMDADAIIVLDQGKIVGQGTHQELLEKNQVYQEIAYSQLSKEELNNG